MFVYVVRPEGFKYDLCENGTQVDDGSGLCMTFSENLTTLDLLNATTTTLLTDLSLDSEVSSQTKSPLDGEYNIELDQIEIYFT